MSIIPDIFKRIRMGLRQERCLEKDKLNSPNKKQRMNHSRQEYNIPSVLIIQFSKLSKIHEILIYQLIIHHHLPLVSVNETLARSDKTYLAQQLQTLSRESYGYFMKHFVAK
ncbi:hypothetical protein AT251_04900 [Enterovibrio nigricans]|nr:hypothetical protein AT251_04900 [Enterovibrio nigricans]